LNTSLYIAKRYLFSKKSTNAINIISGISMLGVFVGSAALIIILSVFNGFEGLVLSMYKSNTPDLKIEPAKGKTFDPQDPALSILKNNKNIAFYSEILQEKALLRYDKLQFIGKIKGVSKEFAKNNQLDSLLIQGEFILSDDFANYAVVGSTVELTLGINIYDLSRQLVIYSPNKNAQNSIIPADEFVSEVLQPVGIFQAQQEENDMVIIPLEVARKLLGEEKNVSYIEIFVKNKDQLTSFIKEIKKEIGDNFTVKDKIQQNPLLYKILNSEKWAVYLILTFVLIIAIFNIIGSLTMLVIDKRKDIAVLNSLGAPKEMVSKIFLYEGLMIAMIGCVLGLFAGFLFCYLQLQYGFISMGQANLLVDAYPVSIKLTDFLLVFATVFVISFIASFISSRLSIKRFENLSDDL
jgi:lipoprotein-releasing system permease protein